MRKEFKKTMPFLLVDLMLVLLFPGGVWAEETGNIPVPGSAPLNPDFVQYMDDLEKENMKGLNENAYYQGYIPPPLKRYEGAEVSTMMQTSSLPATYDLRTINRVTAIRDQKPLWHLLVFCEPCFAGILYQKLGKH